MRPIRADIDGADRNNARKCIHLTGTDAVRGRKWTAEIEHGQSVRMGATRANAFRGIGCGEPDPPRATASAVVSSCAGNRWEWMGRVDGSDPSGGIGDGHPRKCRNRRQQGTVPASGSVPLPTAGRHYERCRERRRYGDGITNRSGQWTTRRRAALQEDRPSRG